MTATAADIAQVRARQRELGVPECFEWLAEVTPSLRARIEAAGLPVAERPLIPVVVLLLRAGLHGPKRRRIGRTAPKLTRSTEPGDADGDREGGPA